MKEKTTLLTILLVLIFSACTPNQGLNPEQMRETASILAETSIAETMAAMPTETHTQIPPTATATLPPTETPTPAPSLTPTIEPSPTITPTVDVSQLLRIFVLEEGTGELACGDRAIPIYINVLRTDDPVTDVSNGLATLFSIRSDPYFSFANPLGESNIHVAEVKFSNKNTLWVNIGGDLIRPEIGCGWEQLWIQLIYTARTAAPGYVIDMRYKTKPMRDFLFPGA